MLSSVDSGEDKSLSAQLFQTVFAALAVAGAGWIIKATWTHGIEPRLNAAATRAFRLGGSHWKVLDTHGMERGFVEFRQFGNRVLAKLDYSFKGNKRIFRYRGKIEGNVIRLLWEEDGHSQFNLGSLIILVAEKQDEMEGRTTYVRHEEAAVVSDLYKFVRVD